MLSLRDRAIQVLTKYPDRINLLILPEEIRDDIHAVQKDPFYFDPKIQICIFYDGTRYVHYCHLMELLYKHDRDNPLLARYKRDHPRVTTLLGNYCYRSSSLGTLIAPTGIGIEAIYDRSEDAFYEIDRNHVYQIKPRSNCASCSSHAYKLAIRADHLISSSYPDLLEQATKESFVSQPIHVHVSCLSKYPY